MGAACVKHIVDIFVHVLSLLAHYCFIISVFHDTFDHPGGSGSDSCSRICVSRRG